MDNTINSLVSQTMATGGTAGNTSVIDKLTKQILATSDPTTWSGQGFGSAQANAADMAKIIAATGATDISQFGKIQVPTDVPVIPKYQYTDQGAQVVGYTDQNGKVVDPSKVTQDENGSFVAPIGTTTAFGNKTTGQAVGGTYGERQVGNAFGGTFAGSGNTGYRVNFDAQGNPQFYTTGASSSNLKDYLAPALMFAGAAMGMPGLGELGGVADMSGLAGLGAESSTLGSLGTLGGVADMSGLGSLGVDGLGSTVAGMGTGTGLTAAGAGGLGGTLGAAGFEGALGAGLTTGVDAGALGSTLGDLSTGVGSAVGSNVGSALGAGAGSALGTTLATGLELSALGNVLGTAANQSGISDARNLINQYGTQAQGNLAKAYADAQGLNVANRGDLASNYAKTQGNLYDIYNQQVGIQQPYQAVGQAGSQGLIANQPYFTNKFNTADLYSNLAPNYAFQLGQGQMANQRAGNMGGGALGGNALQGLQKYTQDYAGNAYQQAFTNYNTQRNNIYNSLAGMANIGTTSGGQLAGLGNTLGGNLGSLSTNYGGNITTNAGQGIGAANAYGLNTANLATGIGSALAGNAVAGGANTANALNTLGNTALLGSIIKAT